MKGGYNTGADMWEDYINQYGIITARIMCLRYLDMQADRKDPEERQFCAELREAMTMERNLADKPLYRKSWEDAQRDGEEELFRDSDLTNGWCAAEIDEAIRACEYGDGSHRLEPAVQAMLEHCGEERLSFILAVEVRRYRDEFSAENIAWSDGFDIQSGFAGSNIRARSAVLDEFITCLRETIDRTRSAEVAAPVHSEGGESKPPYTNGAKFWRDLMQASIDLDAALLVGNKHIDAILQGESSEDERWVCTELSAAMNKTVTERLEKAAAYIVEMSARETTTGNYITHPDNIPADILSPSLFSKHIDTIVYMVSDYGAVLDIEVTPDGAIDVIMGLGYCPNYAAMPGEEDAYPDDRQILNPLLTKGENLSAPAECIDLMAVNEQFPQLNFVKGSYSEEDGQLDDDHLQFDQKGISLYLYDSGHCSVFLDKTPENLQRVRDARKAMQGNLKTKMRLYRSYSIECVLSQVDAERLLRTLLPQHIPIVMQEKPSVMKQIRDAQNAPKPPRGDKSPEQRKKKGDIDL